MEFQSHSCREKKEKKVMVHNRPGAPEHTTDSAHAVTHHAASTTWRPERLTDMEFCPHNTPCTSLTYTSIPRLQVHTYTQADFLPLFPLSSRMSCNPFSSLLYSSSPSVLAPTQSVLPQALMPLAAPQQPPKLDPVFT